jgi:hypothetical protein
MLINVKIQINCKLFVNKFINYIFLLYICINKQTKKISYEKQNTN